MVELADVVPAGILEGFGVHVAPVNPAGKEQAMVTADGRAEFNGVVTRFI
jgi:hypothetical protein